jgi:glutathione synthase/RimK-type ligase-like ATP-grasp enzyme
MALFIFPYRGGLASVRGLRQGLNARAIRRTASAFKPRNDRTIINWGSSALPYSEGASPIINKPEAVALATNKLDFFKHAKGLDSPINSYVPGFFTTKDEAVTWLSGSEKRTLVCRQKLTGHSGEGIHIATDPNNMVEAPLYVQYKPKAEEYRLHVFGDEVKFVQRKARRLDVPNDDVNWQVRNHANGFIYQHNDVELPPGTREIAVQTVQHLGLDFGAVDIIYVANRGHKWVLEVNTAPGLEGRTLEVYAEELRSLTE